jgi:acid ceramidase
MRTTFLSALLCVVCSVSQDNLITPSVVPPKEYLFTPSVGEQTPSDTNAVAAKPKLCDMAKNGPAERYPPSQEALPSGDAKNVSWAVVNLDAPPQERWAQVIKPRVDEVNALVSMFLKTLGKIVGEKLLNATIANLEEKLPEYHKKFPTDFGDEMSGIAKLLDTKEAYVFVYNMAYSLFGACTSIITETPEGEIYHGRNLDFGLWPKFDLQHEELWELTELLRPLTVNVDFQSGGKTLFKTTQYAGFIGVLTAVRPGAFALSIDTRFDDGDDVNLIRWIRDKRFDEDLEVTMLMRKVMTEQLDYERALAVLQDTKVIGPAYIIISGTKSGEGAVLTKGVGGTGPSAAAAAASATAATTALRGGIVAKENKTDDGETIDVWKLENGMAGGKFLVETNYDHWKSPPKFDNRRDPCVDCLNQRVAAGGFSGFSDLYNVLSAKPNLNRLTTYTTLMHSKTGDLEAYRQHCKGLNCPLW